MSGASSISTDHEDDEEPVFEVGQSVRLIRKPRERTAKPNPIAGRSGVVKFIGRTRFKSGLWIGVDMGEAVGKNDGSIQGERYFKCGVNCGIFVRQSQLEEVEEGEEEHGDHFDATEQKRRPLVSHRSRGNTTCCSDRRHTSEKCSRCLSRKCYLSPSMKNSTAAGMSHS